MPKVLVSINALRNLRSPPLRGSYIRALIDSDQIEGYVVPGKKDRRAGGPLAPRQLERILRKREAAREVPGVETPAEG
jgi:hypothetical protein